MDGWIFIMITIATSSKLHQAREINLSTDHLSAEMKPQQERLNYFPKWNSVVMNPSRKYSKLSPKKKFRHSWSPQNYKGVFALQTLNIHFTQITLQGFCCVITPLTAKLPGVALILSMCSLHCCGDDSPGFWHTIRWQCLLHMPGTESQLWVKLSSPTESFHWLLRLRCCWGRAGESNLPAKQWI